MARLIVKSPYIQGKGAGGYLKYIGTRDGVELLPSGYMAYMAERPQSYGLFGDEESVDMDAAMQELNEYPGNIWTHIISLKREDAERLGYDNAKAWCNLLRTHRNDIAAAMHISPKDFRWCAAFHNEGDHPHVHMMAWSAKPGQAYLNKDGIRKIKSELTNDIFHMEMLHLYEQKSVSRDELVRQARKAMRELTGQMQHSICDLPEAEQLVMQLAAQLETVKGKKSYGYLPKSVKKTVDEIVDQMEQLPVVNECYEAWWTLQCQVDDYYAERERQRPPLSQQKEFHQIKNAVIREAENIRLGVVTFEDGGIATEDEPEETAGISYDFWALRDIIQNDDLPMAERDESVARLQRLAEDGNPHAQYLMGKLWRDGPLLTPDWVNARYWFTQAAEQGSGAAQYALGKLLLSDDPEVRDPDEGIRWLKRAAQNGSQYAAYRLGKLYLQGEQVPKDVSRALEYLTTSAQLGNQYAQYMLGKLYLMGQSVPQDQEQAIHWLTLSTGQGNAYAQFFLDRQDALRPLSVMLSVTKLLYHMSRIFQEQLPAPVIPGGIKMDRKLRRKLQEKKIALGHKPDDHEEQQHGGWNMTMG
ncbi:MobP3 family relaxase [uncultured Dysosmobacter sp.]|uniref:MobP3 family relaxase n=1 Tax=uncultured Dysosmobacter sp. TaxID=2591384 RepID=UPI00261EEFE5|nr:MobP3 family relaxase [uncultured Dysosmobacter sp.]